MNKISPYINTKLFTLIPLNADQMDNKIYINMKKNLENKLKGKCYKNYGIITDIYEITNYKDGVIEAENFSAAATFEVEFSCKLCAPLNNREIICQINIISKYLMTATNGPIIMIIQNNNINSNIFKLDTDNNFKYVKDNKVQNLEQKDFVKIKIIRLIIENGSTQIKGIGYLIDIASDSEIETYYNDIHTKDKEYENINEYQNKNIDLLI